MTYFHKTTGLSRSDLKVLELDQNRREPVDNSTVLHFYEKYDMPHPDFINLEKEELVWFKWEENGCKFVHISLAFPGGWSHTFLVFRHIEGEWNYLSSVDFEAHKYSAPQVGFAQIGGDDFLVFRPIGMSGTGVLQYFNDWRLLGEDEIKPVLLVLSYAHVMGWGNPFNRKMNATSLLAFEENAPVGVGYVYEANFWPRWCEEFGPTVLNTKNNAFWRWCGEEKRFIHDASLSSASEKELFGLFYHGVDGIVEEYIDGLSELELTEDAVKWLHLLERSCSEEENIEALRRILGESFESDYFDHRDDWYF